MLLQITNTCHGNCIHCLQDSTPEPQHMSMETFNQFIKFCVNTPTTTVNISGGEPTEHPHFEEIVRECAKHFMMVTIISNGFFVFNREKYLLVKKLLSLNNVFLQITTHKLYYPKYREICAKKDKFIALGEKCALAFNPNIYIHQLGRAANNELCQTNAVKHRFTTSCLMATTTFWQLPFNVAILNMESRYHFCTPLVDWQGYIHLSESWKCPHIGHVSTFHNFMDIVKAKPCGKCADYQKILDNDSPQYIAIREMMGINKD